MKSEGVSVSLEDAKRERKQETEQDRAGHRRHVVRHAGDLADKVERVAGGEDQKEQAGGQREWQVRVHIFVKLR